MKEVITSRILRTILLLIAVCFVSFPAHAKYGGGTGEPNDPYLIYTAEQARRWRSAIRTTLFVPDPLPQLAVENHGRFEPAAGVVAERVSYATQFAMRVPAIVYSPRERRRELPALIIVNGHGGDKYSWYAFYSGVLYARAGR